MARFDGIRRLLHIQREGEGIERAVNDEVQFHFDMTIRELMAAGMSADDARDEARRRFGDVRRTTERLATIDRSRVGRLQRAERWNAFTQDLRYALRGLRLKPGFALAVIVTLGLGIGANATMFGIVDRLLFRPPNMLIAPDRVGIVYLPRTTRGTERLIRNMGYRQFIDIRANARSFDAMTPFYAPDLAVGSGEATRLMSVGASTSDLWSMFDVKPVIGRFFSAEDDDPAHPTHVIVASYGYWQTQFGGRKDILGTTIDLSAAKYTIIGVAPEGFNAFAGAPLMGFVPIASAAEVIGSNPRSWYTSYAMQWFLTYARRKPGVSVQAAAADLTRAHELTWANRAKEIASTTPAVLARPRGFLAPLLLARGPNPSSESRVAMWLGGVALVVLLIAVANVANLLLARALRRRREIAVRVALGISRGRLLRQFLTESLLLAILGGVAGLMTAQWGGAIMRRSLLEQDSSVSAFADPRLMLFVALLAVAAGFLAGLAPAFQAGRTNISAALKAGAREGVAHRSRLRIALLITQAALSVVLLVGAGLFIRSIVNLKNVPLGFDAGRLLVVSFNMRGMKLDSAQTRLLHTGMAERAKALPGVEMVARALTVPFWTTSQRALFVPGIDTVARIGDFSIQAGTPELFRTLRTHVIRGRGITEQDRAGAPYVVVVTEAMAKKLWPGEDPIGKTLRIDSDTAPVRTVVGVAENVRRQSLSEPPEEHYYLPIDQWRSEGVLFVRTMDDPAGRAEAVRRSLQRMMPGLSYVTVTPMTTFIGSTTRSWELGATMFTVFGALALVLAAIGLYSVIAYDVTQRTHEMGVRIALGARVLDVVMLIVREGLGVVVAGVALGLAAALAGGRWLQPLLFEVSSRDPSIFAVVTTVLVGIAIAASWLPAQRAARVDPNIALRAD